MKREDIKHVIGKLEPDTELENRITVKASERNKGKKNLKKYSLLAASIVTLVALGVIAGPYLHNRAKLPEPNAIVNTAHTETNESGKTTEGILPSPSSSENTSQGLILPVIELPKDTDSNVSMDMIGLIVYQGRIYTQTSTLINPTNGAALLGEKIGRTKGNIDEWSKQEEYAVEFASTIGEQDVFSVKGYEESFRLMTYNEFDGETYSEFYECWNGITLTKGEDLLSKLKIENNISSAKFEAFQSWNHNENEFSEIIDLQTLNSFIVELNSTDPYSQESLSHLFYNNDNDNQKIVYITLNDGCEVQLRLFKDGYVFYGGAHVFFKMDSEVFKKLWDELV